jgi:hypothetical protein
MIPRPDVNDDIRCTRITIRGVKTTSAVSPGIKCEYGCVLRILVTMMWFKSIKSP